MRYRILIVEDSQTTAVMEMEATKSLGDVDVADSLDKADTLTKKNSYDLIILDLTLPDGDGMTFLSQLKNHSETKNIPVILVSGAAEINTKVTGFHLGAADYMVKPVSPIELRVRCERLMDQQASLEILEFESLRINVSKIEAEIQMEGTWQRLDLTVREFKILAHLASHKEQVFTRDQIIDQVWGTGFAVNERTVDTHISALRRKIKMSGVKIESIRQIGYRLIPPSKLRSQAA